MTDIIVALLGGMVVLGYAAAFLLGGIVAIGLMAYAEHIANRTAQGGAK